MDFLEDFPRVFQKYLGQNEMFSNSAAGQLIRLFTPIFITNDFNNIAYTFKQVSGKKGSKGGTLRPAAQTERTETARGAATFAANQV